MGELYIERHDYYENSPFSKFVFISTTTTIFIIFHNKYRKDMSIFL